MLKETIAELYDAFPYTLKRKYSRKFRPYNANIRLRGDEVVVNMSREWKGVSAEIQRGLIQELLLKLLRKRVQAKVTKTQSIDLYHIFLKKVHLAAPTFIEDSQLLESFNRVNAAYFDGLMDETSLRWGSAPYRKLGSYEYGADTITISTLLREDGELLDYVMYHEMLHKKHKFTRNKTKSYHHTAAFKADERKFRDWEGCERRLKLLGRKKSWFGRLLD
jgi:predicted metal-dependent hydrolase